MGQSLYWVDVCGSLSTHIPEQMGHLLHSSTPEQVRQCVKVPDIKLIVQGTTEAHADKVGSEEDQDNLCPSVKVQH